MIPFTDPTTAENYLIFSAGKTHTVMNENTLCVWEKNFGGEEKSKNLWNQWLWNYMLLVGKFLLKGKFMKVKELLKLDSLSILVVGGDSSENESSFDT